MKGESIAAKARPSPVVAAAHATTKSGYAKDIVPSIALTGMAAAPIPPAAPSGRQEGVVPPGLRTYTAKYEALTLDEVMARARARSRGEMPPIEGGVTTPPRTAKQAQRQQPVREEFDPFAAAAGDAEPYDAAQDPEPVVIHSPRYAPAPIAPARQSTEAAYLAQRKRIMLELPDTTLRVSAVDVIPERYCVTVLMPLTDDGGTFVPKPGTEVKVVYGDKTYACYFPGASFEIEALKLMGLTFIRTEEG